MLGVAKAEKVYVRSGRDDKVIGLGERSANSAKWRRLQGFRVVEAQAFRLKDSDRFVHWRDSAVRGHTGMLRGDRFCTRPPCL